MNAEGFAEEDVKAAVVVPEKTDVLPSPSYFKVIAFNHSTLYSIRWHLPQGMEGSEKIKNATLYWCKRDKYEQRCLVSVRRRLKDLGYLLVKYHLAVLLY